MCFPARPRPRPGPNILANPRFGALVTERGGGFTWYKNSRFGRLTPFDNDPLREGWGEMLYVLEGEEYFLALPGPRPAAPIARCTHRATACLKPARKRSMRA